MDRRADGDEAQLLARAWEGDRAAFGRLLKRHHRSVYAYAFTLVRDRDGAEDVAQEVFLRAWRAVRKITDAGGLLGWLFQAVRYCVQERGRADQKFRKSRTAEVPVLRPTTQSIRQHLLLKIVSELADDMRAVLILKYQEDLSCEEIARRLGRPVGTVTSLLSRAYHEIRERMKREEK